MSMEDRMREWARGAQNTEPDRFDLANTVEALARAILSAPEVEEPTTQDREPDAWAYSPIDWSDAGDAEVYLLRDRDSTYVIPVYIGWPPSAPEVEQEPPISQRDLDRLIDERDALLQHDEEIRADERAKVIAEVRQACKRTGWWTVWLELKPILDGEALNTETEATDEA